MKKILSFIDALSIWSGKIASWLILFVIIFIIYEILMRYVFHLPTLWVSESMVFGSGLTYVLGAAWALQDGRLLAARRDERAGWYLDPAARLDHAVPFVVISIFTLLTVPV